MSGAYYRPGGAGTIRPSYVKEVAADEVVKIYERIQGVPRHKKIIVHNVGLYPVKYKYNGIMAAPDDFHGILARAIAVDTAQDAGTGAMVVIDEDIEVESMYVMGVAGTTKICVTVVDRTDVIG